VNTRQNTSVQAQIEVIKALEKDDSTQSTRAARYRSRLAVEGAWMWVKDLLLMVDWYSRSCGGGWCFAW
jgi:hypothetical protein